MNNAIEDFKEIYNDNKNFTFNAELNKILFSNEMEKKQKLMFTLFICAFIFVMMLIAGRDMIDLSFIIYSLLVALGIALFSVAGKVSFELDFNTRTFSRKGLFSKRILAFADIKDVRVTKVYLNFISTGYHVKFLTKAGKADMHFLANSTEKKSRRVLDWVQTYMIGE